MKKEIDMKTGINMKTKDTFVRLIWLVLGISIAFNTYGDTEDTSSVARGKYLIEIGGCNDCHTTGFAQTGGEIAESDWLLGDGLGFRGPWGTTYPSNLREFIGALSEDEWVIKAKVLKTRPPMPWWALNYMTEKDLRSLYRYVISLGVVERSVPSYVPPDKEPQPPYIQWPMPAE